jgi:hypothetical protein
LAKDKVIRVLVGDDWSRLYLNDEMIYENHSISDHAWLKLCERLGAETETREVEEDD